MQGLLQGPDGLRLELLQLTELALDEGDELAHPFGIEHQARTGGFVELRQRLRAPEREGGSVVLDGLLLVLQRVSPDLQGAELRDGVFNVIERVDEDVQLLVPASDALLL